jgi:hypothetical protein
MNNDKRNDVFIVLRNKVSNTVSFKIAYQQSNSSFKKTADELFTFAKDLPDQQPVSFQIFDDKKESLITYITFDTAEGVRTVGHIYNDKIVLKTFASYISGASNCRNASEVSTHKLSATHGSAFIDLNMDCRPDLWIEATNEAGDRIVETYFFKDTNKFCLVSSDTFPDKTVGNEASSFSFIDLLRKGANHALAVDSKNNLHVMINRYNLPNPENTSDSLCTGKVKLGADKKHLPPFEGITSFGNAFNDVSTNLFRI